MAGTEKKTRLGRGLDALLGGAAPEAEPVSAITSEVPLTAIEQNPYQPRKSFDQDELASLTESIKNHGVLQPLVVRQVGERFQLIAGERRFARPRPPGWPRCRSGSSISTTSKCWKRPWSRTSSGPI